MHVALLLILPTTDWAAAPDACPQGTVIVVEARRGKMFLCEQGKEPILFPVAIGRGGIDKRKQGDNKTPIGTYELGVPRASSRFHLFIPIGYPTPDQRKLGFTGSDVGIHGPTRIFRWPGRLNTLFGWTQGCVAVGTDDEIITIAAWVKEKKPGGVILQ
ncbi:MAG TPA: hypothetical protein DD417_14140 [Elusimicrobia bacterium]|nr:hypothetical protein [Elusimicrobiota bacterium]